VHLKFHTHETAGNGITCYLAALEGGADGLDLSMAPVSGGTCQPDIITMWHALRGSDYDLGVDIDKIRHAETFFKDAMADYFLPPEAMATSPEIIWSPMPGGALTANTQMMRDNNILDKYDDLIVEMYDAVRLGGFGTSVTPVSQFYVQQALNNVMFGKWKKIAPGYGRMVLGYFGRTPVAPAPEIIKIAGEQLGLAPTTTPVLKLNDADPKKGRAAAEKLLKAANLPVTDENVFIAASCFEKGIAFLKDPAGAPNGVRKISAQPKAAASEGCTVTVNGRAYGVILKEGKALVDGREYAVSVADGLPAAATSAPAPAPAAAPAARPSGGAGETIAAPVPGIVLRLFAAGGAAVKSGDELLVLEAMKMEIPVKATADGTVTLHVAAGDRVNTGDALAAIH
jgi:pyruvate carboxylase subunit B